MPARIPASVASDASRLAESIIAGLDATGICAVEFFWTTDGQLVLNDLTLGPHSTGLATIEASVTSQFHQHLRAVLDWPLGPTTLRCPAATVNLIGGPDKVDLAARLPSALSISDAHVHLYPKSFRPGRTLGHVTALGTSIEEALGTARTVAAMLTKP